MQLWRNGDTQQNQKGIQGVDRLAHPGMHLSFFPAVFLLVRHPFFILHFVVETVVARIRIAQNHKIQGRASLTFSFSRMHVHVCAHTQMYASVPVNKDPDFLEILFLVLGVRDMVAKQIRASIGYHLKGHSVFYFWRMHVLASKAGQQSLVRGSFCALRAVCTALGEWRLLPHCSPGIDHIQPLALCMILVLVIHYSHHEAHVNRLEKILTLTPV